MFAASKLLATLPRGAATVTYLQITPVSGPALRNTPTCAALLDELVGRINGAYGDFDWVPLRYLTQTVPRERHSQGSSASPRSGW